MRRILFSTLAFTLAACSTMQVGSALDKVSSGMTKSEVLEVAENPKRTYREDSKDHWIYVYFEKNRELSREVIFEGGKVEQVTRPHAKTNWEKELEGAAPGRDAGFKDVP